MSKKKTPLNLPFDGCIDIPCTTDRFKPGLEVEIVRAGGEDIEYRHSKADGGPPKSFTSIEEHDLEALVVDDQEDGMLLITFRHPNDEKKIITVVLAQKTGGPTGQEEVDGIWVADDEETIDLPPDP